MQVCAKKNGAIRVEEAPERRYPSGGLRVEGRGFMGRGVGFRVQGLWVVVEGLRVRYEDEEGDLCEGGPL